MGKVYAVDPALEFSRVDAALLEYVLPIPEDVMTSDIPEGPVSLLFEDGAHSPGFTRAALAKLRPRLAPRGSCDLTRLPLRGPGKAHLSRIQRSARRLFRRGHRIGSDRPLGLWTGICAACRGGPLRRTTRKEEQKVFWVWKSGGNSTASGEWQNEHPRARGDRGGTSSGDRARGRNALTEGYSGEANSERNQSNACK
jgi:hypothetical protein